MSELGTAASEATGAALDSTAPNGAARENPGAAAAAPPAVPADAPDLTQAQIIGHQIVDGKCRLCGNSEANCNAGYPCEY